MNGKQTSQMTKLADLRGLIEHSVKASAHAQEAAYRLRFVRIAGIDVYDDLIACCNSLNNANMPEAAHSIANIILTGTYNCSEQSKMAAQAFLEQHPIPTQGSVKETIAYDSREKKTYRLSCILSLYKEEKRTEHCVKRLARQTLYQKGELELVFIDSNSPENERAIFERLTKEYKHILYCKTDRLEKLSAAWNRGVLKSTGLYLTFNAPSNVFVDDGLEHLLYTIENDDSVLMVQGDVAKNMSNYSLKTIPLHSGDLERSSNRSQSGIIQLNPFFYVNYLAFDCCAVRRSLYDVVGGFDEKYFAAMENKFHLTALQHGKLVQTGKLISAAYEDNGPRLTGHPRIEIEHFLALYESSDLKSMIKATRFVDGLRNCSRRDALGQLQTLSLEYHSAYLQDSRVKYYDLDAAETIARETVLMDNSSAAAWNDYALIKTKNQVRRSRLFLHLAASYTSKPPWHLRINCLILYLIEQLLQWVYLFSIDKRLQTDIPINLKHSLPRRIINRLILNHNKHRTFQPDIFGDAIW